jgi:3-oxoadipate enol-lactonase
MEPSMSIQAEDGTQLDFTDEGEGRPVVLLHGLTASKRYVLMGSRMVHKNGFRVVSYDARGHGASGPAADSRGYEYTDLVSDLSTIVSTLKIERPIGVGISMGAHTLAAFASQQPDVFSALLLITPAYLPGMVLEPAAAERWHDLANGLRSGGAQGFVDAGAVSGVDTRWRDLAERATLQRMQLHANPSAVADALDVVPGSPPFEDWSQLMALDLPVTVVGSRDEADPGHPLEVADTWAKELPDADFAVEESGESPLAWRGASLSKLVLALAER